MLKSALIALMSFLFAGAAAAQIPTSGNAFVGYSFQNASSSAFNLTSGRPNMQGWEVSVEGKVIPLLGIVADFSGHYGSENVVEATPGGPENVNITGHQEEVLFGPRVSVSVGKFRPFAEAEVGVGHVSTNNLGSDTSFATAIGGGLDYRIIRPVALRLQGDYVGTRFFNTTQSDVRLSTGVVFRF